MGSLQFPLGIRAAACVRVGNALGAGNTTRAIVTCKVVLVLAGMKTYTYEHKHEITTIQTVHTENSGF